MAVLVDECRMTIERAAEAQDERESPQTLSTEERSVGFQKICTEVKHLSVAPLAKSLRLLYDNQTLLEGVGRRTYVFGGATTASNMQIRGSKIAKRTHRNFLKGCEDAKFAN